MEGQDHKVDNVKDTSNKEKQKKNRSQRRKKERIRLIPIWLRLVIVLILVSMSLLAGLMFGFGVVGEGNPVDAIKPSTWYHIFDIISGKE